VSVESPILFSIAATTVRASRGGGFFLGPESGGVCERAGIAYPLDAFTTQANAVLGSIAYAKGSWAGTTLPPRTEATVQRLADANFPLRANQAQELLKVLDALIGLGDRRSTALEQTEAFRRVQGLPAASG
jgi:hypothetical protein